MGSRNRDSSTEVEKGDSHNARLVLTKQTYTLVEPKLERLSKIDPTNVQAIVAAQIGLMDYYYREALEQARRSFHLAAAASGLGLVFFIASVLIVLIQQPQDAAVLSLVSGGLIEVIAAVNFYLYGKASEQMADFQGRLERTQRFVLANSICENLEGEARQRSRSELVRVIAGISSGNMEAASDTSIENT